MSKISEISSLVEGKGSVSKTVDALADDGMGTQPTPPTSNTGGQKNVGTSEVKTQYLMVDGKVKEIPLRRGISTCAHIDTLTFTLRQDVFIEPDLLIDDMHVENISLLAQRISSTLHTLFGFGISEQKNGLNGYRYSFSLGTESTKYGVIAFGGAKQKDSVMIYLYGEGLTAAKDGWEKALYNWLQVFAPYAKITRCDLAHDFIEGEYTPEQAKLDWIAGGFTQKHTRPRAREHGYDWLDERYPNKPIQANQQEAINSNRTGKTFYVGTPQSSRMVRVYEKGRELGDKNSSWVRFELQLRNRDYVIPHEILIAPGEYLMGAYPICESLFSRFQQNASKAKRIKKTELITIEHVLRFASQASSPCVNMLEELGFDCSEIVMLLKGGKFKLPKRLGLEKFDCSKANERYIHEFQFIAKRSNIEIERYFRNLNLRSEEKKRQEYFDVMYGKAQREQIARQIFGEYVDEYEYF